MAEVRAECRFPLLVSLSDRNKEHLQCSATRLYTYETHDNIKAGLLSNITLATVDFANSRTKFFNF